MRDYGKVQTTFWTSADTSTMTDTGRMLALYLLTSPHSNILGCFHLPIGYVCEDLKWGCERVAEGFAELFDKGFATHDLASKWVVLHAYLKWNPIENPNQGIAAGRLFEQIPNRSTVKPLLAVALRHFSKHFPANILADFETLSERLPKPFRNQEQEQEQEQEHQQKETHGAAADEAPIPTKQKSKAPASPDCDLADQFEEVWAAYPKRAGASKADSLKAWKARIKAGATADEILEGVWRYAKYVAAERTEDRFIKQPQTFFGPGNHFRSDWSVRAAPGAQSLDALRKASNEEAKRRLFGAQPEMIHG